MAQPAHFNGVLPQVIKLSHYGELKLALDTLLQAQKTLFHEIKIITEQLNYAFHQLLLVGDHANQLANLLSSTMERLDCAEYKLDKVVKEKEVCSDRLPTFN